MATALGDFYAVIYRSVAGGGGPWMAYSYLCESRDEATRISHICMEAEGIISLIVPIHAVIHPDQGNEGS